MRLINAETLKSNIKKTVDMQDLYLPVHFLEIIDNEPTVEKMTASEQLENNAVQYTRGYQDGFQEAKQLYEKLELKGEWIQNEKTFEDLSGSIETYTRSTCSVCNQANDWGEVPYCPWCGARMEKKDDRHGETDQEQRGRNQATY